MSGKAAKRGQIRRVATKKQRHWPCQQQPPTFKSNHETRKGGIQVFSIKLGPHVRQGLPSSFVRLAPFRPGRKANVLFGVADEVGTIVLVVLPFHQIRTFAHGMEPIRKEKQTQSQRHNPKCMRGDCQGALPFDDALFRFQGRTYQ